ncbi:MAG: hypothetical protein KKE50_00325 [Nanoarchaeota archaeon]|nr:hypothetical protein [Nanoarchaeota archaeon]
MNERIEQRRQFIYGHVGKEALNLLRESGLDIDNAVTNILEEQEQQRDKLEAQAEFGTVEDIMTSELVYRSNSPEDVFGREYSRRLHLIGLEDNQIKGLHQVESLVLSTESMAEHRKQPWVRRYFITPDSTPENIPEVGDMTLSELILITDDANSAFWRDHPVLPEKAWQALCVAACCAQHTKARYAHAFNARTEKLGLSKAQSRAYTRNECLLTERLKWGNHENSAWTPETTDLKQYQR